MVVPGGTTKEEIKFLYRDSYECLGYLTGNPLFHGHFDIAPTQVFVNDLPDASSVYSEMMTGSWPSAIQVC